MRIGVDTGGTFADCVVFNGAQVKVLKVLSTPENAARAILEGVERMVGGHPGPLDIIHGTTVGTNSLLERRGARVGLVTTAGFEDLIEIGRQARPRLYDLNVRRAPPLVPRALRWGVKERVAADGSILIRPTAAGLRRLRNHFRRSGVESVALCFLFSFANPSNERAVARALAELRIPVSVSHEILPEFREYERLSTVAINAYLAPHLGAYLASLEGQAARRFADARKRAKRRKPAMKPRVYVMQSSGGITTAASASREPVRTILSGPAGGVVGAAWLAGRLGIERAISFDMGGTSTDVSLLDGALRTTHETLLGGLPVAVPVLDVHSVGEGGGSLARLDAGGALRVGPQSAGAEPGPICYARGGTEPTVTDAHVMLGRLKPEFFLGGSYRLDSRAVERHFVEFLRRPAGTRGTSPRAFRTPLELARGIVAVSNAAMEKALRVISVERGHDPRDFSLICFGGAGGLHAADLARALDMPRVLVPQNPGAFSALGILLSDVVKDVSQSVLLPVSSPTRPRSPGFANLMTRLNRSFDSLERMGRAELESEGSPAHRARAERRLDVRYVGQAYELSVPFIPTFAERFHAEHERVYGYAHSGRPLEIVNLRVRLRIPTAKPRTPRRRAEGPHPGNPDAALLRRSPVWFGKRMQPTPFFDRKRLQPGMRFAGPAIIAEYSSTTVVPPDFICRVDDLENLELCRR
jgi:N-methylhydantoinase A